MRAAVMDVVFRYSSRVIGGLADCAEAAAAKTKAQASREAKGEMQRIKTPAK
jgi:hypothetical protein